MSSKTMETTKTARKIGLSFAQKFGLDPERKKLGVVSDDKANPPTVSVGENFSITKIKMTESRKKYQHVDSETDEIITGRIPIAQLDIITEKGELVKTYSPNSAIIEACRAIIADEDFKYNAETFELGEPCQVSKVIEGKGEKNRSYIAFQ